MNSYQRVEIKPDKQLNLFCAPSGLPALDLAYVSRRPAQAHWLLLEQNGEVAARCSLWWQNTPAYDNHHLGLIGHYAARRAEAGTHLLRLAGDHLAGWGCTLIVGPLDGHTWHNYRLVTEPGQTPPFFTEPYTPAGWPDHFSGAGFSPLAHYTSLLTTELIPPDLDLTRVARRAHDHGFSLRSLQPDRLDRELHHFYTLATASFRSAFLYTPIAEADFVAQYRPLQPYLQPELILLAERAGRPVGFLFALPDWLQAQRGQPVDTVIIRTLAVQPEAQTYGLGTLLVARCHETARQLGYSRAIHALMHERNVSVKISRRFAARPIRGYALFGRLVK